MREDKLCHKLNKKKWKSRKRAKGGTLGDLLLLLKIKSKLEVLVGNPMSN